MDNRSHSSLTITCNGTRLEVMEDEFLNFYVGPDDPDSYGDDSRHLSLCSMDRDTLVYTRIQTIAQVAALADYLRRWCDAQSKMLEH